MLKNHTRNSVTNDNNIDISKMKKPSEKKEKSHNLPHLSPGKRHGPKQTIKVN